MFERFLYRKIIILSLFILNNSLFANPPASNKDLNEELKKCAKFSENIKRLTCYDSIVEPNNESTKGLNFSTKNDDLNKDTNKDLNTKNYHDTHNSETFFIKSTKDKYTTLSQLYDLDENDNGGILTLRAHYPTYVMPFWLSSYVNSKPYSPTLGTAELIKKPQKIETKLQFSFKTKLIEDLFSTRADAWFGYTQVSYWQSYNSKQSAPFRENNYAPEIFITQPIKWVFPYGITLRMLGAGFIHESNGREDPFSRSWNRIYAMAGIEWNNITIIPMLWYPIITEKKGLSDNPDISHYKGYGQVTFLYRFLDRNTISARLHGNPGRKKGGLLLSYNLPIKGRLKFFIQGFYGYGENMIDYNRKTKSLGIGLLFNDWDGF